MGVRATRGVAMGANKAGIVGIPVECRRTDVGESQSQSRGAAGVTGDLSS